jgi:ELWxxDGT repeat protein
MSAARRISTLVSVSQLTAVGNNLFFSAIDDTTGSELWKTDGINTNRVTDIRPGPLGSFPYQLTAVGQALFFEAYDDSSGRELWTTDGTTTNRVADLRPGSYGSRLEKLTAVGSTLFFVANDGISGSEVWTSDGTTTSRFADLSSPFTITSVPTAVGNILFFPAKDSATDGGTTGVELWKTDGITTSLVADIYPGKSGSMPDSLTAIGSTLFFVASDESTGREIWKTDGVVTSRVTDIYPGSFGQNSGPNPRLPLYLTKVGNTLFFTADDGTTGFELWKTDGITTNRVADINPGSQGSIPRALTAVGNTLYFQANDGTSGIELWKTDGTTTSRVADLRPGSQGSIPKALTAVGDTLYFAANDGSSGVELWKSDGTSISLVADINRLESSHPRDLTVVGDTLFFIAKDGSVNSYDDQLWAVGLGPDAVITMALSPATVREDGPTNLLYTFSRTGSTSASLTVNYTVGGSATLGDDYRGISATPSTKSITFPAGSAIATVSVAPSADRNQEGNETVALRLVAGSGYTLGTASAVTGTILNDDRIGTSARNTIVGTALAEFIDGLQANDTLTGGVGPDVFGFRYSHSTLTTPDRITDFRFGSDKIDLFTASGGNLPQPKGFTRASNNSTATTLSALATAVFSDANGSLKGNQALGANRAALVVATKASIAGTYLFINDGTTARNNSNDLLIHLTSPSGALPGLGVIPVGSVFA